jgi:tetratricopeptide (TPR) repeat protein
VASGPPVAFDSRLVQTIATLTEELANKNKQIDQAAAEKLALQGRVSELEHQLRAAVARTLEVAAQPGASAAAIEAAAALGTGETRPAEALLADREREAVAGIGTSGALDIEQRRLAAQLAREQGALAMSHDVRAALASFERALEYEPDDPWTHFFIGDLHMRLGDLGSAEMAFSSGFTIAEARAARDPANTGWQRDLSVSHNKVGDVLVAQGDGAGALAAYRRSLTIAEALAARDPANTEWQRDLSYSLTKLASWFERSGNPEAALELAERSLHIDEHLAALDPTNATWQSDVRVSRAQVERLRARARGGT